MMRIFFQKDHETEAMVLIGMIDGNVEEKAARFHEREMTKSEVSCIDGITAPPYSRMGHASAIALGGKRPAEDEISA